MSQKQNSPQQLQIVRRVIIILGFAFGLFWANRGYNLKITHETILNWPSVPATIIQHDLYEQKASSGSKMRIAAPFTPLWTYTYKIDNQEYTSNSRSYPDAVLLTFKNSREAALEELKKYPLGQTVTIFYNPLAFNETIIEKWPRDTKKEYFYYSLGAVIFIISLAVPWLLQKKN